MLQISTSKIIGSVIGLAAAVVIVLGANSAFAADSIYVDTHTTGARSRNHTSINLRRNNNFNFTHRTNIDNNFDFDVRTGGNRSSFNTGSGFVRSGSVNADVMVRNSGYSSHDMGQWFDNPFFFDNSGYDISVNTDHTGYNSNNRTNIDLSSSNDVRINHRVDINNDVNVTANTGNNHASYNTGDGYVSSGDVNIGVSVDN